MYVFLCLWSKAALRHYGITALRHPIMITWGGNPSHLSLNGVSNLTVKGFDRVPLETAQIPFGIPVLRGITFA